VLDLTRIGCGPTCARQLTDCSANVIKVDALLGDACSEQLGSTRRGWSGRLAETAAVLTAACAYLNTSIGMCTD
jgi:crotonobetainyl-CoA:carnitine CoA-transferase CaiB-like acyl-CoA transferase